MSDDDMEDYGFEYSDEDVEEEDVDIENQYYNSKGNSAKKLLLPLHLDRAVAASPRQIKVSNCRHA